MQEPFAYKGMAYTFFSIHREDCRLMSICYLHSGAPKWWYSIPEKYSDRLEDAIQKAIETMPKELRSKFKLNCRNAYSHREVLVKPSFLRRHKIPFGRVMQNPGDFIITCPGAIHYGFNTGENLSEALNIAEPHTFFKQYAKHIQSK